MDHVRIPIRFIIVATSLLLTGCLSQRYNIRLGTDEQVSDFCHINAVVYDDGTLIEPDDFIRACYDRTTSLIYVSIEHLSCLDHEVCHADDFTAKYCSQVKCGEDVK